jgi:hypothetical protein
MASVVIVVVACVAISAHDRKNAGALSIVIGWATEPAFSGSMNGVVVSLADRAGPLTKADGSLSVEVTFGTERITLPLAAGLNRPHEFHAALVPTRAGTYTFHVTGRINNQPIDVTSTCGERTFHCVTDAGALQFPVRDPSAGELAERISRAAPRADEATQTARSARMLALAAIAVSLIAIASVVITARRALRKPR